MRKILRKIRKIPFLNKVLRFLLKFFFKRFSFYSYLSARWVVSGIVRVQILGTHFKFFAEADDYVLNSLYYHSKTDEDTELALVANLAKKCTRFLDIGANTGLYSVFVALNNPQILITAFEPHPENCRRLEKNLSLNRLQNINIEQSAVGDSTGKINFYIPKENRISDVSSVFKEFSENIYHTAYQAIEVDLITVDEYIKKHPIQGSLLIKIDVEGYELEVLKGAIETITSLKPLFLCEVFSDFVESEEQFRIKYPRIQALQDILFQNDYHIYEIKNKDLGYLKSLNHKPENRNYLFSPKKITDKKIQTHEAEILL